MPIMELQNQTRSEIMDSCKTDLIALWRYIIVVQLVQVAVCFVDLKPSQTYPRLYCIDAVLCSAQIRVSSL